MQGRMRMVLVSLCAAGGLLGLIGCGRAPVEPGEATVSEPAAAVSPVASSVPEPTPAPPGQTEVPAAPPTSPDRDVSLRILDWDQVMALVQEHAGQVVVVDVWATYCPPCIKEFPQFVKLHRERAEQVACISLSLDYEGFDDMPPESYRDKVLAFLKKQKATMTNVLCSTNPEAIYGQKLPQQSIPVVLVFDKQGNLAGQFPDPKAEDPEFTYEEDVRPLVEQLIAAE